MNTKYIFSSYDAQNKDFILKKESNPEVELRVHSELDFSTVNTNRQKEDYVISLFVNPFLTAQNDLFPIYESDIKKTVGFIIPLNALIENSILNEFTTDEKGQILADYKYLLKYVYYTYLVLLDEVLIDSDKEQETQLISLADIYSDTAIIAVFCKIIFNPNEVRLVEYLPSLALQGYYRSESKTKAPIIYYINNNRNLLAELFEYYLGIRAQRKISIKKCSFGHVQTPILTIIYQELLSEIEYPLYRFHLLYQVVELFISLHFQVELDALMNDRDSYSRNDFYEKLIDLRKERKTINKIVNSLNFDIKDRIADIFKTFMKNYRINYDKNSLGDFIYDIRNLLFHDYRNLITNRSEEEIVRITGYFELVVHNLVKSNQSNVLTHDETHN